MRRLRRAQQRHAKQSKRFKRRAVAAGTAAVVTLATGVTLHKAIAAPTSDAHQLIVSQDADADLLANAEELAIGYRPFESDQNRNETPDGVELAKRCAAAVSELPIFVFGSPTPPPDETYKMQHGLYGLEQCDVCGEWIHMGGWEIINPQLALRYPDPNDSLDGKFLPDLALHYMEHGSFDCYGAVHTGRVDMARLLRVLDVRFPCDPNDHQIPVTRPDLDGDLLTDNEELKAGYNLYDPDQDDDLLPDGIELAKQCGEIIDQLPTYEPNTPDVNELHKLDYSQRGIEHCDICGTTRNMGYWHVINPKLGLSIEVPDILCHYMEHGSFSYSGDIHGKGRIDVPLLAKILEMPRQCGHLGTVYLPGDLNRDCRLNFADLAETADNWLDSTEPANNHTAESNEASITYHVEDCDRETQMTHAMSPIDMPTFSLRVEGSYIHFDGMVPANCCPDEIELKMTVDGSLITIYEIEHLTDPCRCACDFPATAKLGPFDDGTYVFQVYRFRIFQEEPQEPRLVGTTTVNIGSSQ
ncbi:MAG: hypothetical protein AMJ75_00955 [Phycisphaerae bacterium SM1_79]|nr:MAG: hypothetical protein AMJ75_00955 [Phycisphaerae bacterium SM1_79]